MPEGAFCTEFGTAAARPGASWPGPRASAGRPRRCLRRWRTPSAATRPGRGWPAAPARCRPASAARPGSRGGARWPAASPELGSASGAAAACAAPAAGRAQVARARPAPGPGRPRREGRSEGCSCQSRPAEDQRAVAAAESEVVAHRVAQLRRARLRHQVERPECGSGVRSWPRAAAPAARSACAVTMASTMPAAPSVWPVTPLVEDTGTPRRRTPPPAPPPPSGRWPACRAVRIDVADVRRLRARPPPVPAASRPARPRPPDAASDMCQASLDSPPPSEHTAAGARSSSTKPAASPIEMPLRAASKGRQMSSRQQLQRIEAVQRRQAQAVDPADDGRVDQARFDPALRRQEHLGARRAGGGDHRPSGPAAPALRR